MSTTTHTTKVTTNTSTQLKPSALRRLRAIIPTRDCEFAEALQIAERQATLLAGLLAEDGDGIQLHQLEGLPRIRISYDLLPVSGLSHWNGREWVISLSAADPLERQRFTALHEFKHIIDHGHAVRLYTGSRYQPAAEQAERVADYFAGCALVSKRDLKRAWGDGLQRPEALASHFAVSVAAIRTRLSQTGLDQAVDQVPTPRCARPISTPRFQPQRFVPARSRYPRSFA